MTLRPFVQQDLPAVEAVFLLNTPDYFSEKELDDLRLYLQAHAATYRVAEENGIVVGAGGYHLPDQQTGRLSWDFLHPDYRGKGYGRKLIEHCLQEMSLLPLSSIEVHTSQHACHFYEKFGFQTIKVEKNHWDLGLHLYLMVKEV